MPVKLLLADKSITIQKVVEMLFSGREYDVVCVSDGETALSDAVRIIPDIVLADVDLPRIDGYSFAGRLKQTPTLAQTPVILMMSRDDVYDEARGRMSGIMDYIAKPFESQELIGKVKKALAAAPPRLAEPAQAVRPVAPPPPPPRPAPAAAAPHPAPPVEQKPKQATPADIWDIIEEAPTQAEIKQAASHPSVQEESIFEVEPEMEEESVLEVEPEMENEEELAREVARALPVGDKALEEMRVGLGLNEEVKEAKPKIMPFESFDMEEAVQKTPAPAPPRVSAPIAPPVAMPLPIPPVMPAPQSQLQQPMLTESDLWSIAEETIAKMALEMFTKMPPVQQPTISESDLRSMAEQKIAELAQEVFIKVPPPQPPKVSEGLVRSMVEETVDRIVRETAREVIEKVAWEIIPDLAEQLIRAEIERLKAEP